MYRLFIAIDLSICKLYREFKNGYMYVWLYYFHLISSVLMITYYFVCALSQHESILEMCSYLWEQVRLVENGLQDHHTTCVRHELRFRNFSHLMGTIYILLYLTTITITCCTKNGSPLYNTMFILFDINALWFQSFHICCNYERTNKHCQSTHAITLGDY